MFIPFFYIRNGQLDTSGCLCLFDAFISFPYAFFFVLFYFFQLLLSAMLINRILRLSRHFQHDDGNSRVGQESRVMVVGVFASIAL
jgi:hypothetical protein